MNNHQPAAIIPFLTVHDGKKAVDFYKQAFAANETSRYDLPGDKISAVLDIAGATIYVGDEEPEFGNLSPAKDAPVPVRIVLKTMEADIFFERAIAAGAVAICPMTTEADWRMGKLKDPFGHIWELGYEL
ncbi:MAG: VOC family protein [Chitinophagaceae bacterium]|nr:MAG: VOC family protein [Chitinophagaceae bacterium]